MLILEDCQETWQYLNKSGAYRRQLWQKGLIGMVPEGATGRQSFDRSPDPRSAARSWATSCWRHATSSGWITLTEPVHRHHHHLYRCHPYCLNFAKYFSLARLKIIIFLCVVVDVQIEHEQRKNVHKVRRYLLSRSLSRGSKEQLTRV